MKPTELNQNNKQPQPIYGRRGGGVWLLLFAWSFLMWGGVLYWNTRAG
ncbi:hypothetical protein [Bacterioplanes sanyensis]|nr:hypothetical protein [Bacterioplanes sanyensis]